MSRILLVLSFISIAIVSIGTAITPNSPIFWLATHNMLYENIRAVLALILLLQIASRPPRYLWFRVTAGIIAGLAGVWAIKQTFASNMLALDSMSILGASITIVVVSLEGRGFLGAKSAPQLQKAKIK